MSANTSRNAAETTQEHAAKTNAQALHTQPARKWPLVVLALAFGVATALGVRLREASFVDTLTVFVLYTLASGALLFALLKVLNRPCERSNRNADSSFMATHKTTIILFCVAFIPFLLMLLANYPGVCTPDSSNSMEQSLGIIPLNNHTTLAYTLLVAPFICIGNACGNVILGIFLYSLAQCVCMAATITYTACWFMRKGAPRWLVITIFCFYVLNPIVLRYGITMWKDIPFSMAMLLYVLVLADTALSKGAVCKNKSWLARLIAFTFLVCMLRGNGVYVIAVSTLVLVLVYKEALRKTFLCVGCSVLIVSFVVTGPVYTALGVTPSPFKESAGILLQQVGYVYYSNGTISENDQEVFESILPLDCWENEFILRTADGLKFNGYFNDEWLNNHKAEFLSAWFNTGLQNVRLYIEAWLYNTQGYWDIAPDSAQRWVCRDGISATDDETGTNYLTQITGIAWLESDFADNAELRSLPLLYPLFNLASMFWIVASVAALWLCQQKKELLTLVVPLLAVWLTLMIAAPDYCQFRYMFSFHMCLPVVVALLFSDYWVRTGTDSHISRRREKNSCNSPAAHL